MRFLLLFFIFSNFFLSNSFLLKNNMRMISDNMFKYIHFESHELHPNSLTSTPIPWVVGTYYSQRL